jgi:translocation and assembly module TamB
MVQDKNDTQPAPAPAPAPAATRGHWATRWARRLATTLLLIAAGLACCSSFSIWPLATAS